MAARGEAECARAADPRPARGLDPRLYQISVLTGLLAYGVLVLHFDVTPARVTTTLAAALLAQYVCTRAWRLPAFDPKSALISGLSLCLLLRANSPLWAVVAAALAIASKFTLRVRGKHVMNPTNFALVALLAARAPVWVSPGQWGNAAFFAFLMACLGGLVVNRASRSDVTYAFAVSHVGILLGRALWLGEPPAVPLHRLENGAFLLFTFFMISDPRTTPDARAGRVLFAFLVAAGAAFVQFGIYRTNGLLWSLAALSVAVPLIDRWFAGARYEWRPADLPALLRPKGAQHANAPADSIRRPGPGDGAPPARPARAGVLRLLRRAGRREAL